MVKLKDGFTGERALVLPRIIVDKMEEDPLTSMLHITDIGYYPKAKHHFGNGKSPSINMSSSIVLMVPDLTGSETRNIPSPPISILFFRQESRILMLPTNRRHGLFTGFTSKVFLLRSMPKTPTVRWIFSPNNTPASVRGSTCLKRYSIHSKMVIATRTCVMRFLCFTFIWERYAMSSNIVMQAPMRQKTRE